MQALKLNENQIKQVKTCFYVNLKDETGKKNNVVLYDDEFEIVPTGKYLEQSKPAPALAGKVKVESINKISEGNGKLIARNLNMIESLINILSVKLELSTFVKLGEMDIGELYEAENLFQLIINLAETCKEEINNQVDFRDYIIEQPNRYEGDKI